MAAPEPGPEPGAVSYEEAARGVTADGAMAGFMEGEVGMIR